MLWSMGGCTKRGAVRQEGKETGEGSGGGSGSGRGREDDEMTRGRPTGEGGEDAGGREWAWGS